MECRQLQRTRVAQPARVLAEQAGIRHDCIVENLSTLGACSVLDTTTAAELPLSFDLTFDNWRTYWHCDIVWRDDDVGKME